MDDDAPEVVLDSAEESQGLSPRRVKASNLLWFISSRPYVPMSDLRRRFNLLCEHGTVLRDEQGPLHLGLPRQAAEAILDLKRKNKVGLEYDYDVAMRVVVGVYPMRVRLAPTASAPRSEPREPPVDRRAPDADDVAASGAPEIGGEALKPARPGQAESVQPGPRRRSRSRRRR